MFRKLSLILLLVLAAVLVPGDVQASPGTTTIVSVDSAGNQANNFSQFSDISGDGRFVAFESVASNLVPGDSNNRRDIFSHDRQTGVTTRVSVTSTGIQANGDNFDPAISGDGRFVAFSSEASNLAGGDPPVEQVLVHDRQTGVTTLITAGGNMRSFGPAISGEGRFVAFESGANNLVPNDTNGQEDIFVHDRDTDADGAFDEPGAVGTFRVSVASDGSQANHASFGPGVAISADGRFVGFFSHASNLVAGDTNNFEDVFVHDRQTGVTTRVSVASDGTQGNQHSAGRAISLSGNGRFVAFPSGSETLVPGDTNAALDVFVHDLQAGTTERVSVASDGTQGNGNSRGPAIALDGRLVAFESFANNLVAGDTNALDTSDIFIHDRQTGATVRISVDSAGNEADSASRESAISADGRFTAFSSHASNLVTGDTNGKKDIFVHDQDPDADGAFDRVDPCPSNPDCDGDGYLDGIESHSGTNPLLFCSADSTANNEDPDARPTDFNDDRAVTGADLSAVAGSIGQTVPPAPVRKDIAPDPAGDNAVTGADLSRVAAVIGTAC